MDEDDEPFEYTQYFEGPCTCEHEEEEHGWDGCRIEGCPCEAHWTE